jgi:hypothetical protein
MRYLANFCLVFAYCGILSIGNICRGDDFRVDNAVYQDNEKTPSSASVTIFHKDIVYDCMPQETVVFNKPAGQIVLLNMKDRTRTLLTAENVDAFVKQIQQRAADAPQNADPLVKFLAKPTFSQTSFDSTTQTLTMGSPLLTYKLMLAPQGAASMVSQYHDFSDWSAKLNTMLVPGSRPPFARLQVNAAVAEQKSIASQVILTFTMGKKKTTMTVRSTHRITMPLTQADINGVSKIGESLVSFPLIGFDEYRKASEK